MMFDKTFHEIELEAWTERAQHYDKLFAHISSQAIDDTLATFGDLNGKCHLDIACGTGHLVAEATRRGAISEGTDFAETMINVATKNHPDCVFSVADASNLPFEDATFDAVTCAFGLLHMEHPQQAFNEVFRVLKPGGKFAFTLWFNNDNDGFNALVKPAITAYARSINLPKEWTLLKYPDEQKCKQFTDEAGFLAPQFEHIECSMQISDASMILDLIQKLSVRTNLMIESQSNDDKQKIFDRIIADAEAQKVNGVINLGWPALLTSIQKPAQQGAQIMINQLEAVHTIYDSIDDMLEPTTLSALTGREITQITVRKITEHNGLSGSQVSHVETDNGRFFMKKMSLDTDYIMKATDDTHCRQVTLWQYGILDELQPKVNHGVIAAARDGDNWALLMHDLKEGLFTAEHSFNNDMLWLYLDRMAYIHATFWNDSRLEHPELGLTTLNKFSSFISQNNIASMEPYSTTPLHEWFTNGWIALRELVSDDVYQQIFDLTNDPQPLIDVIAQYPRTLVHGDYRHVNFATLNSTDVTVFDWQFACYTLMTADIFEVLINRDISDQEAIKNHYRERLQHYLGITFDDDEWHKMIDLGLCAFALQRVCIPAFLSTLNDEAYEYFIPNLRFFVQCILDGLKWI